MFTRQLTTRAVRHSLQQSTRSFSAAAASQEVKLPVQLYGLSARYANALYTAAVKKNAINAVEKDLKALSSLINEVPAFNVYLQNPIISRKDKVEDVQKFSKGMNDLTRGFLSVLAENGRLNEVEKITATFAELLNAERGLVEATVVSAAPLNKNQVSQLEKSLQGLTEEGKKLVISYTTNPEIIGGLQVQVGDKFVDLSIQSKIQKMWKGLKDNTA